MTEDVVERVAREPMEPFLAVFNGHINNASDRARKLMREGSQRDRRWLAIVEGIERENGGIMAIFDWPARRHSAAVSRFAKLVARFVNEDAVLSSPAKEPME